MFVSSPTIGSFREKNFEFKEISSGRVVANVTRKGLNVRTMFGADTYIVTIQPGIDAAFIVAS
eukprot:Awhi_evm1s6653